MKNNNTQQLHLPPFIHDNGTPESEGPVPLDQNLMDSPPLPLKNTFTQF